MRFIFFVLLFCFALYAATPIGTSYLNMQKVSTPSSPASGYMDLYFKDDGAPFYLTSGGTETRIAGALSVGTIDSQTPAANGLVVSGSQIYAQSASSSAPGLVNNSAQQFSGVKTFVSAPIMSALTASEVVVTNSSKALSSIPYAFPATGTTIPIRDSNGNLVGNVIVRGTATVVSAGATTSMNGGSAQVQKITGTNFQNFNLPDATTLISGWTYDFNNNSTQNVFIKNNGGSTLATAIPGSYARAILTDNSTSNGTWDIHWELPTASSFGTGGLTVTGNLLVTGTITSSTSITSPIFSSSTANPASAGAVRLANSDLVEWRNAANGGNNTLGMSTDTLTYSGAFSASSVAATNNLTGANVVVTNTVSGNALSIGSSSQFAVTGGGSVGSGTWNATAISTAKGGTGQDFSSSTGALVVTTGTVSAMSIAGNTNVVRAPTVQKFTSGSGTYTRPSGPAPLYIKVEMVGGGGGGGSSASGAGGNGGNTTFGTTLLTANGGTGCSGTANDGGAPGTASLGTGPVGIALSGSYGAGAGRADATNGCTGGIGGTSALGGAGYGGSGNSAGVAGATNSGSGGGGGGASAGNECACGGGSGGYVSAIITNPSSTYSYAVGAAGTAGGGGGNAGGAGGSGVIVVTEYYQ